MRDTISVATRRFDEGELRTMKRGSLLYVFLLSAKTSSMAVMVQRQEKTKKLLDGLVNPRLR